uniref:Uncharacterized protein n=1 Tax=Gossypium raimondii TaxID=29730 RepID=A0A0D2M887_GOSRA|nr:hypothetical protein B456_002G081200 [Gossypium raimondii]
MGLRFGLLGILYLIFVSSVLFLAVVRCLQIYVLSEINMKLTNLPIRNCWKILFGLRCSFVSLELISEFCLVRLMWM